MKTVTIYTDGACSGNPGPGGWGRSVKTTCRWHVDREDAIGYADRGEAARKSRRGEGLVSKAPQEELV